MNELEKGAQEVLDRHDQRRLEDITEEYNKVMEWLKRDWPETHHRLEVNWDRTKGLLTWKLTIISGKEATPNDQKLVTYTETIGMDEFTNEKFMSKFLSGLLENYKKTISEDLNEHYNEQRGKSILL